MSSLGWSWAPSSSGWPQTMHRPGQSGRSRGAIGSASEIASRIGVVEVELVVVGQPRGVGLVVDRQRRAGREVDRRQVLLGRPGARGAPSPGAGSGTHSIARAVRTAASARTPRFVRVSRTRPSMGPARCEVVGEVDQRVGDLVVAVVAGLPVQEPGHVPDERLVWRARGHGRMASCASSVSGSQAVVERLELGRRRSGRPAARRASRSPS